MTLPRLKQQSVKIAGIDDELVITEMNAAAYVGMLEARTAEKSEVEVSAIVCKHCVVAWQEHTVEEVMQGIAPAVLTDVMRKIINLTGIESGNSEADQRANSSVS